MEALQREARGQNAPRNSGKPAGRKNFQSKTPGLASKSHRAQQVASSWIAQGNRYGWEFPYNDVWLGNLIHDRVVRDEVLAEMIIQDQIGQVMKVLAKMVDLFWRSYVDDSVSARNAHDFLFEVWDDLRYYAISSLRAKWLKQHGVHREPHGLYEKREDQEMQKALQEVKTREFLENAQRESEPESGPGLDSETKDRLRSMLSTRRKNAKERE